MSVNVDSNDWMLDSSSDLPNHELLIFFNFHQQFIHFIHSLFSDAEYFQTHDQSLSQSEDENTVELSTNMQHVTHKHSWLCQIVFRAYITHIMQYNFGV